MQLFAGTADQPSHFDEKHSAFVVTWVTSNRQPVPYSEKISSHTLDMMHVKAHSPHVNLVIECHAVDILVA